MKGDVPTVVEHTNSAVSVSLILSVLGIAVAVGGTMVDKRLIIIALQRSITKQIALLYIRKLLQVANKGMLFLTIE